MTDSAENAQAAAAVKQLKRLRRKAEICRFAHGEIKCQATKRNKYFKIIISILSLTLSALVVILYRKIFNESIMQMVFLAIAVLPYFILFFQSLGNIFGWEKSQEESSVAIYVWGKWIREADFWEKKIPQMTEEEICSRISKIEAKYIDCMEATPLISSEKFLLYKAKYTKYRLISEKMDDADESKISKIMKEIKRS